MKKSLILGLAILFVGLLTVACTTGYGGDDITEDGFRLKVTVDKTRAKVGDTVTATVVFINLNDKDIEAELPGWIAEKGGQSKEDILEIVFKRTDNAFLIWDPPDSVFEPRPKILIESGDVIRREFKHIITKSENLCAVPGAFFITDTDTANPRNIRIFCNSKTIKVR